MVETIWAARILSYLVMLLKSFWKDVSNFITHQLLKCFVFFGLFFCHHQANTLPNVAPSGTATQSSTIPLGDASHAIDGNKNTYYEAGFCTHTYDRLNSWWSLLLPAMYSISSISITNRNIVGERINKAEILIGNSLDNNGNNNPR